MDWHNVQDEKIAWQDTHWEMHKIGNIQNYIQGAVHAKMINIWPEKYKIGNAQITKIQNRKSYYTTETQLLSLFRGAMPSNLLTQPCKFDFDTCQYFVCDKRQQFAIFVKINCS